MATRTVPIQSADVRTGVANGAAMAAFLGAGLGAFAIGAVVLLNEAGIFSAPAVYGPAGGVSGRTTLAVAVWLAAWGALHAMWKGRDVAPNRVLTVTVILILFAVLATFPPTWALF